MISLNGDFNVEEAVYLKYFFGVRSVGNSCLKYWERVVRGTETTDILNRKVKCGQGIDEIVVGNIRGDSFNDNLRERLARNVNVWNSTLKTTKVFLYKPEMGNFECADVYIAFSRSVCYYFLKGQY